jgi:hypothetical protein
LDDEAIGIGVLVSDHASEIDLHELTECPPRRRDIGHGCWIDAMPVQDTRELVRALTPRNAVSCHETDPPTPEVASGLAHPVTAHPSGSSTRSR